MEAITKESILTAFKYLGIGEDGEFPEFLKDFKPISFSTNSRLNNDRDHKVFKFVPIDKIQILLTPCLRSDDIKEKFDKAIPLGRFLNPNGDEDELEKYAVLLTMLSEIQVSEIENISLMQKEIEKKEPFKVSFNKDNLWQIYYSEQDDSYFMLVCTRERTHSEFIYLLKKKLELNNKKNSKNSPKIFVPINYTNYSGEILGTDEIKDLENYLWVFTKNWPLIFEVYNKDNNLSLQIVGETYVYENVKSTYKVKLSNQEEALKFFKLLKALFIMHTEIKNYFNFTTEINSNSEIEFCLHKTKVDYDGLEDFIRNEYESAQTEVKGQLDEAIELNKKLNKLKKNCNKKEQEYLEKQRQISTFLEYRKSFFGKMRFFIKGTKSLKNKKSDDSNSNDTSLEIIEDVPIIANDLLYKEKDYYTIEDLVTIYNVKDKNARTIRNITADTKAVTLRLENLTNKVKNATQYISEIDEHRKSIFDFWKFANKDEKLALEQGSTEEKQNSIPKISKSFNLLEDLDELGEKIDSIQRANLTPQELDSIFIAKTNLLYIINMLRSNDYDKGAIEMAMYAIKEELNSSRLHIETDTYDIFGNSEADNTKERYIGSKAHREADKSKFKILGVNKKLDIFDFTEKLQNIVTNLNTAIDKAKSVVDCPIYKVVSITNNIKEDCFDVFDLDIEKELSNYEDDGDEGAINLLKINFKQDLPLIYYSNITMMDNNNQTLPKGMNLSTNVLIDCSKFKFTQVKKTKFRTNNYFSEKNRLIMPKAKDVIVFEYDIELK